MVQWLTPVILATREAEIGRIMVRAQLEKKFKRPPPQLIAEHGRACHHPSHKGGIDRRMAAQAGFGPGHKVRPYLKNNHPSGSRL
jgi:hypothetical protein